MLTHERGSSTSCHSPPEYSNVRSCSVVGLLASMIERRPPGFEFTPGLLGKISTYVVISPGGNLRVFAFMYSFLVESESDEDRLAAEALALIEDRPPGPGQRSSAAPGDLASDGGGCAPRRLSSPAQGGR